MEEHLLKEEVVIESVRCFLFNSLFIEGQKGCDAHIWQNSVDIEPEFEPYELSQFLRNKEKKKERKAVREVSWNKKCLRLWIPSNIETKWNLWEDVLKELTVIKNKISFEILGNEERVSIQLILDSEDSVPVKNAIKAKYPKVEFEELQEDPLKAFESIQDNQELSFQFLDYFPMPPYFRNLTSYETMIASPLSSLYPALSSLSSNEIGVYQVIFKPCRKEHNWHRNIMNLVEAEYKASKYGSLNVEDWYSPATGHEVLHKAEKKAHPEKPFFAVCVRVGVLCSQHRMEESLRSLGLALANFRYGGTPLNTLNKWHYVNVMKDENRIAGLLYGRASHRQGMLLNSAELVGLCHLPSQEILESGNCAVDALTQIHAVENNNSGIVLGTNTYAGKEEIVRQPEEIRCRHTAILGKTGMGKSVLIENMVLQDIEAGRGAAVIDPHGELIEKILTQVPRHKIEDVILFDPCDDDYVLCFNPLDVPQVSEAGRIADDFTVCFRNLFTSWGERMENIFRHSFYALLKAPWTSLSDLRTILSKDSAGETLRRRTIPLLQNEEAVRFWTEDFPSYHSSTLDPVLNKLSKFLLNDRVARIFCQKQNRLNFRRIIDRKKVMLMYLPAGILGSDSTNIIGSLALALFYHAAMSRTDTPPEERMPFYLYVDEFQRFRTKSTEDLLRESRKYNLGMIMAFQQREQITESVRVALGNVGSLVAFGLGLDDAQRIFKEFGGQVEIERLLKSGVGEAYVMVGNSLTTLATFPPRKSDGESLSQQIRESSSKKYYAEVSCVVKTELDRGKSSMHTNSEDREVDLYDQF